MNDKEKPSNQEVTSLEYYLFDDGIVRRNTLPPEGVDRETLPIGIINGTTSYNKFNDSNINPYFNPDGSVRKNNSAALIESSFFDDKKALNSSVPGADFELSQPSSRRISRALLGVSAESQVSAKASMEDVRGLINTAEGLLNDLGIAGDLNCEGISESIPVITTRASFKVKLGNKDYFLRPVKLLNPNFVDKNIIYLVLGASDITSPIVTENFRAITISSGENGLDTGLIDQEGNNLSKNVKTAQAILNEIRVREEVLEEQERISAERLATQEENNAVQRKLRQKYKEELEAKRQAAVDNINRREKLQRRRHIRNKVFGALVVSSMCVVGLRGAILVASTIKDNSPGAQRALAVAEYDDQGYRLNEGTVLRAGESGSPKATIEMINRQEFAASTTPELGDRDGLANNFGPNATGGDVADKPASLDNPRQIILTTSKPRSDGNPYCEKIYIDEEVSNGGIIAATDMDPRRVNQLRATVSMNTVEICWVVDAELNDNDDPRIIIQRYIPAANPLNFYREIDAQSMYNRPQAALDD